MCKLSTSFTFTCLFLLNTFVFALDIKQLTDWSTVGATAINTKPIQQLNISELGGKARNG